MGELERSGKGEEREGGRGGERIRRIQQTCTTIHSSIVTVAISYHTL